MRLLRWWRSGPGAIPISNRLRVALCGYVGLLVTRWVSLSNSPAGYIPAGFTRVLILSGIGFAAIAIVTRWRCVTIMALTVVFTALVANIAELLLLWHRTGFFHGWGILSNCAFAAITYGLDRSSNGHATPDTA